MLSVARARLAFATQIVFFGLNAFGLLFGTIYNGRTPDMYEQNLHHKLGWAITWVVLAQIIIRLLRLCTADKKIEDSHGQERLAFMPLGTNNMTGYHQMHPESVASVHRYSHDSGHGTESNTSRSDSPAGLLEEKDKETPQFEDQARDYDIPYRKSERLLGSAKMFRLLSRVSHAMPNRIWNILTWYYDTVDILILIIGFVAILTGLVTYGGVFCGSNIFNGLAHSVKGGIFF
ncbi:MAG: hypothetical protein L6R42_001072, partial [Xanthoria sp. 1 TBL-2021]